MAGPARPSRQQRLLGLVAGMFVLLLLQNAAGTWLNLYVKLQDRAGYEGVFPAMLTTAAGTAHTLVGILIGLNALLTIAVAWRLPDRRLRSVGMLVLALVGAAAYFGYHFVYSNGDSAYSFAMEVAFMGIVLAEAALLYLVARPPTVDRAPVNEFRSSSA
jgi:hypothetical protein